MENLLMEEKTNVKILELCDKVWGERKVPPEFKYRKGFRYYAVQVNFGHLSHNKSYLRNRYMVARNIMDAMKHAKKMPRAKKHKYDVVPKIVEISYKEYLLGKLEELQDPYLRLDSRKGQKFDAQKFNTWIIN